MIAVLFTTAFFAELAGLAPIIGAFMAGLLMNRLVPTSSTLMSRIQFVGNALFIPFFLISVGMLVDIKVLGSLDVWMKAIVFSLLVFFGKGLASLIVRYLFKFSNEEGWVIFGLTTPQSAATLAVTLVGFELGFFETTAVNAVVIMILITCLVGPWLVEKYGRAVAIQEDEKPYEASDAPQRILVPLANPETSDALMDIAFMVRDKKFDQPINPLTVARDGVDVEAQVARGEKMLSHAVIHAAVADVPVNPVTRVDMNISKGIARAVSEMRITNIIIGWNGQVSTKRAVFGTILDQLLKEIDEMVMVCKIEKPMNTFERIVVAIPPYAALEAGFKSMMRSVKLLTEQIGGELIILATEDRESFLKKKINSVKPDLDYHCHTLKQWNDLPKWQSEKQEENDLFILVSSREGSISWRPGLDRLPRVIAQRNPELSFITIYSNKNEKGAGVNDTEGGQNLLTADHIKIKLKGDDIESILAKVIKDDDEFEKIAISRITRRLLENSVDYTPEAMPGVLVYDAHTSKVSEQLLFVGVVPEGIKVERTSAKAFIIFIFLSPKSTNVEDHLTGLNRVLKWIRKEDIENIKSAVTPKEVLQILLNA